MNYETLNKNHVSHASQKFFRKQTLESKHPYSKMLCVKCTNKYNKDSKQIRICLGTKNRSFLKSVCFAEEPSPISIKRAFVKVFHWPNTYQYHIYIYIYTHKHIHIYIYDMYIYTLYIHYIYIMCCK